MTAGGLFVGSITGTSVDGLDLALLDIQPTGITFLAAATVELPDELRSQLVHLIQNDPPADLDTLGRADTALGAFTGEASNQFLADHDVQPEQVSAIGSHGQTVRHQPDFDFPFTMQIGDANIIAERTKITTVADFRRRDMAAGGQAAPLVPLFHDALFGQSGKYCAIVNIGGISNITLLHPEQPVRGHDTGPGNALLDAWAREHLRQNFDEGGAFARRGVVDAALLATLLSDPYLHRAPPKSTGKEHYNLAWLQQRVSGQAPEDVQATLVAFTAQSIAQDVPPDVEQVVICGGGRLNTVLMESLERACPATVVTAEVLGADGDAIEAAAFAWLAYRRISALPGNAPAVTGAQGERILGGIYPA